MAAVPAEEFKSELTVLGKLSSEQRLELMKRHIFKSSAFYNDEDVTLPFVALLTVTCHIVHFYCFTRAYLTLGEKSMSWTSNF